jgi:malate dehydrogenase (oxaloacetate-decarboxylating)(NADP+)
MASKNGEGEGDKVKPGTIIDPFGESYLITPWNRSVASGMDLLRSARYNKGLAFTDEERERHYLNGLLPPAVETQELQAKRIMRNIRKLKEPLDKYSAIMDLQVRNERLFYKVLIDNVEELLPIVYTPIEGDACEDYSEIFHNPNGLFISLKDKGRIIDCLKNFPNQKIEAIVVTDGERILGLGDLGCQGMGIPVGKLALYTALGGVRPSVTLPVTLDVGTNNQKLLDDEFYIGLRQKRVTGKEYDDFVQEFMDAVKHAYGEKCLVQLEDFANHNAFRLLAKYSKTHLCFDDDIQGTAAVTLAGILAALPITGGTLADHTFLFFGAGEAGTGIAELVAQETAKQGKISLEEARKKTWLLDTHGLVTKSRNEDMMEYKKPFAHDHEPIKDLLAAVKTLKPSVLVGTSTIGGTFTKEVLEALCENHKTPMVFALSNPVRKAECTAEDCYKYTKGKAIFASGSPFPPVKYEGKEYIIGEANNCYIFPGLALGCLLSGAIRIDDEMILQAAAALAKTVTKEDLARKQLYPALPGIRDISAQVAAAVAEVAYEKGLATKIPKPENMLEHVKASMYSPVYRMYR